MTNSDADEELDDTTVDSLSLLLASASASCPLQCPVEFFPTPPIPTIAHHLLITYHPFHYTPLLAVVDGARCVALSPPCLLPLAM
jgi:hypothetical protein